MKAADRRRWPLWRRPGEAGSTRQQCTIRGCWVHVLARAVTVFAQAAAQTELSVRFGRTLCDRIAALHRVRGRQQGSESEPPGGATRPADRPGSSLGICARRVRLGVISRTEKRQVVASTLEALLHLAHELREGYATLKAIRPVRGNRCCCTGSSRRGECRR